MNYFNTRRTTVFDLFSFYCSAIGFNIYSMLPYFPDTPISGHFDSTILYFVVKTKQIRTIRSEDLSTSLLSSVLFAAELRFV